ncbi:MAG: hypothetical protein ACE5IL_17580 [Myxococcota bacterium]
MGISVRNGSVAGMGRYGVLVGSQAEVTDLRVHWHRLGGIRTGFASAVFRNTASTHSGDGIPTRFDCLVQRNSVRANTGWGLDLAAGSAHRENVIDANGLDTVNGGVDAGGNSCNAGTPCP